MPTYHLKSLNADGTPLAFVTATVTEDRSGRLRTFDGVIVQRVADDDLLARRFHERSAVKLTGVVTDGRRLQWSPGIKSHRRNPNTGTTTFELVNIDQQGVVIA